MPPPIILKMHLNKMGVFRDKTATAEMPDLQRYNLIYGFNGSGKTTLSRIFSSLEAAEFSSYLPEGSEFDIILNDSSNIKIDKIGFLQGRIHVFNTDFVEKNLKWSNQKAASIFYLGKHQIEASEKLEKIEKILETKERDFVKAEEKYATLNREFNTYKTTLARRISDKTRFGRKYNASHLTSDYSIRSYSTADNLSEESRKNFHAIIAQDAPLDSLEILDENSLTFVDHISKVQDLLSKTPGILTIEELNNHNSMISWLHTGLIYHRDQKLSKCIFCGNALHENRLHLLAGTIDDRFEQLTQDINNALLLNTGLKEKFLNFRNKIPSHNDLAKELQTQFKDIAISLQKVLADSEKVFQKSELLLRRKSANPTLKIDSDDIQSESDIKKLCAELTCHISALNNLVNLHNRSHEEFEKNQEDAKTRLKNHILYEEQNEFTKRKKKLEVAEADKNVKRDNLEEAKKEVEELRRSFKAHSNAEPVINELIKNYLGRTEIKFITLEDGYQLLRNDRPATGQLSEGEKTAIALCYFLTTIKARGENIKNSIIVIDDPISSLDSKALNYAFSLLRSILSDAAQLIILTHNLNFMNEVKKWLKQFAKNNTATFLFLDSIQKDEENRSTSIKKMPKYIREYESEYHYLFYLICRFVDGADDPLSYFYVMPNALRKVLEIFLAFKIPESRGLSDKIRDLKNIIPNEIDFNRIVALERLAQLESHADNLDDLVSVSSLTIEETLSAAHGLFLLMKEWDEKHFETLKKICQAKDK